MVRVLRAYKTHFKAEQERMGTKVIAATIDRVERTVSGSGSGSWKGFTKPAGFSPAYDSCSATGVLAEVSYGGPCDSQGSINTP